MNPLWILRTARLVLTPVGGADFADLAAIKADPRVFAVMLGGVRSPQQAAQELADDVADWGANGFGTWAIREQGRFLGITGLEQRTHNSDPLRRYGHLLAPAVGDEFGEPAARVIAAALLIDESDFAH